MPAALMAAVEVFGCTIGGGQEAKSELPAKPKFQGLK
jgi:hypothetical protein